MEAVREWIKNCAVCQKTRDVGIKGLRERILTLKPDAYRRIIGVDHVTITPADEQGNKCLILLVEHWSHFPQAYVAKDYTAETVATVLFKHLCTFGLFDELASDPGVGFMAEVVQHLLKWLGMRHKVSLVGRHESNGCESSGKEFMRHLRTLVMDERIKSKWSSDTVLPLINFHLASFPTSETGGLSPFQLKYGTQDAGYFQLPYWMDEQSQSIEFLKRLDKDLSVIREISQHFQSTIVAKRQKENTLIPTYLPGDLLLWNVREKPSDHLDEKLGTQWKGPYEVISQAKNDIKCKHVVLEEISTFHVSRVKPFFGSREDAVRVALNDKDQYQIVSIDWSTGNPHIRTSMEFGVTWSDGFQPIQYNADLASAQPFQTYVNSQPHLHPLRFTKEESRKEIRRINGNSIDSVQIGQHVYLNLRYFDGTNAMWYDSLNLPHLQKIYVAKGKVIAWVGQGQKKVKIMVPIFNEVYTLTTYEVSVFITSVIDTNTMIEVSINDREIFPAIWLC
jgi:hypothetical protein